MLRASLREWRYGRLRLALEFYVPYRLFRVTCDDGRRTHDLLMAVDSVTGQLDPYQFDEQPSGEELVTIQTSQTAPELIHEQEAQAVLENKFKRQVFRQGFFKLTAVKMSSERIASFHLPYWVGIYERGARAHLEVIDAVRGRPEGAKLREVVTEWFERR